MTRKTCDAFLCSASVPKKYSYCYDCAKSKGLIGGGHNWGTVIFVIILLLWFM